MAGREGRGHRSPKLSGEGDHDSHPMIEVRGASKGLGSFQEVKECEWGLLLGELEHVRLNG